MTTEMATEHVVRSGVADILAKETRKNMIFLAYWNHEAIKRWEMQIDFVGIDVPVYLVYITIGQTMQDLGLVARVATTDRNIADVCNNLFSPDWRKAAATGHLYRITEKGVRHGQRNDIYYASRD